MVVENVIEQYRLRKQQQKGQDGKTDGRMIEYGIETSQDEPVEVIVFGMQWRRHRVQKEGKFQHQGIDKQYQNVSGALLPKDTDHGVQFLPGLDFARFRNRLWRR